MKKRIRLDNIEEIQALIDKAEGKAQCRCLSAETLVKRVKGWEEHTYNPSKQTLIGVGLCVQACANTVANAYKYTPMETVVYLEHDTIGWYVTKAVREPMQGHNWTVEPTATTERLRNHVLFNGLRV